MNTAAWIAIAATITTLSTSWGQFWLKKRNEKRRALAAANTTTNQPNHVRTRPVSGLLFFGRHKWIIHIADWLVSALFFHVTVALFLGIIPLNVTSVLVVLYATGLAVLVNLITWHVNKFSISD